MKKLFFTLCALCLCGTMWAEDTYGDDIQKDAATGLYFATVTYDNATTNNVIAIIPAQNDDTYSLGNLVLNTDGTYTLPATVQAEGGEEVALQGVFASAFASVLTDTENLIHLVIPANIIDMGQKAFQNCTQIGEVTVEYSETALDEAHNVTYGNSFSGCSNLKVVTQNRDITIHRNNAQYTYICFPFADLPSIETVYIGEKVTSLANNAYNARTTCQLSAVYCYATDHIPTLANQCFLYQAEGCTLYVYNELVDTFAADKNEDGNGWGDIFSTITGMGSAPLEEGTYQDVTTRLFFEINDDKTTASIYHDEAGIYTDENLVAHATITGAYTLPETVSADGETYYNVTRIEEGAFQNSSVSGHIVIPAFITAIGENAFTSSTQITEVTYEYSAIPLADENNCTQANMTGGSFNSCTGIQTVNLYRDITYSTSAQQPGAFVGLSNITTLNIGPRVTSIYDYMFRNGSSATQLATINCYSVNPPTLGTGALGVLPSGYVVNVPQGTLSDYQTSWSDYTLAEMSNAFAITTHDNGEDSAYATFYNSASDVELFNPDGDTELTAYVAYQLDPEDDGLYIEIESIGNVIPAATGVIVETEKAGTYLAIATGEITTFSETNDLYGYDSAQTITEPTDCYYYLLSSNNGNVGFYYGAQGGAAFTCQAHRAYLAIPKGEIGDEDGNESNGISIRKGSGEDTTGISSVESATEGASVKGIYTIQGVRVSNMNQPGLYIVDGRKVLVK